MKRLLSILPLVLLPLLFVWLSIAREHIIPYDADYERATWLLTGDEPGYLLTAQAIASGDGQNLRHVNDSRSYTNFQQRDIIGTTQWTWDDYAGIPSFKYWSNRRAAWGDRQTLHRPPLVSLLLSPISFAEKGVRWKACVLQSIFIVLGLAFVVLMYDRQHRWWLCIASFIVVGSLPISYYSAQIYPESVTGTLLLVALVLLSKEKRSFHWIAYGLMIASLWGTARVGLGVFAALSVVVVLSIARRHILDVVIITAGLALYFVHNLLLWGYPIPPNPVTGSQLTLSLIPKGVLINFFSCDVGMFFLAPVSFVAAAACILLLVLRCKDKITWITMVLIAGCILTVAAFPEYRAGTCPAGRYQVIQLYLLLFPLLHCITVLERGMWRQRLMTALITLGIPSLIISWYVMVFPKCWFERYLPVFKYKAINRFFGILPNVHTGDWWPELPAWLLLFSATFLVPDIAKRVAGKNGLK